MQWTRIVLPEETEPAPPRWWVYPTAIVFSFLLFGALTYLMAEGDALPSDAVLLKGFLFPSIFCGLAIIVLVVQSYITRWEDYSFRAAFIEMKKREWQFWGRAANGITACTQYVPVDDLTDKILGLSGEAPLNPNVAMKLSGVPQDTLHQYSLSFILNKLMVPMLDDIKATQRPLVLHFYTSEPEAVARSALRQTFERYQLKSISEVNIHLLNDVPDYQTVYEWLDERPSESHLVIMVDFYHGASPDKTEGAVGLLFNAGGRNGAKKEDVYFFRPLRVKEGEMGEPLTDFLAVGQMKDDENIHLWNANLDHKTSNLLTERVVNASAERKVASIASMNISLGNISAVHAWSGVVCAVEAARRQATNSLVAQKEGENVGCVQISPNPSQAPEDFSYSPSALSYCYYLMGVILTLLGLALFIDAYGELALFGWWLVGIAVVVAILALVSLFFRFSVLRDRCQAEWNAAR